MGTKFVTGLSKGEAAVKTAQEAVDIAKQKLGNFKPDLAIVYCSTKYDYQEVVNTIRKATDNAPLIGCSTGGEFTEERVEKQSIAVGLIHSDTMRFSTSLVEGLREDEVGTMKKLAEKKPQISKEYPYLGGILLIDGLAGKGEESPVNLFNFLGTDVILGGGAAADDLKFEKTFVFCDDKVATNAALICYILSKSSLFTSVRHGHIPLSDPLQVTKSKANILYEVSGRPAWEVWKEKTREDAQKLGIDVDKILTPTEIGGFLIRYELGIPTGEGEYKIRVPLSKNDDGSLNFACTIPQGITFHITRSPKERQIESARVAMQIAKEGAGSIKIAGALIFDCVCRAIILGEDFSRAVEEFKKVIGDIPLLGWETYGEICFRTGEFSGFHNTTSVVLLLPAE